MPQQSNFCQSENYLLFFPTLIFGYQILGVMWSAATRVLFRSKRENPGNKVGCARANQASRNLKKFFGWKQPDKFTLFTHFLVGWNLENLNKHPVSIVFFCLRWLTTIFEWKLSTFSNWNIFSIWKHWNNVVIVRNNVATMLQLCVALKIVFANRLV